LGAGRAPYRINRSRARNCVRPVPDVLFAVPNWAVCLVAAELRPRSRSWCVAAARRTDDAGRGTQGTQRATRRALFCTAVRAPFRTSDSDVFPQDRASPGSTGANEVNRRRQPEGNCAPYDAEGPSPDRAAGWWGRHSCGGPAGNGRAQSQGGCVRSAKRVGPGAVSRRGAGRGHGLLYPAASCRSPRGGIVIFGLPRRAPLAALTRILETRNRGRGPNGTQVFVEPGPSGAEPRCHRAPPSRARGLLTTRPFLRRRGRHASAATSPRTPVGGHLLKVTGVHRRNTCRGCRWIVLPDGELDRNSRSGDGGPDLGSVPFVGREGDPRHWRRRASTCACARRAAPHARDPERCGTLARGLRGFSRTTRLDAGGAVSAVMFRCGELLSGGDQQMISKLWMGSASRIEALARARP